MLKYQISRKIRPVGAEFFHADRLTNRHEATVGLRNFANAPKKETHVLGALRLTFFPLALPYLIQTEGSELFTIIKLLIFYIYIPFSPLKYYVFIRAAYLTQFLIYSL